MQKESIAEGIYRCIFDPLPRLHFSDSIIVLVDGGRALFIDTGYAPEAQQALSDIGCNGLELDRIILSHFHDDHMQGLKVLPGVPVIGSAQYQATLDMWNEKVEHPFYTPGITVVSPLSFDFGEHQIEVIPFPGHSLCTVLTKIDDTYLHVADELMFGVDGAPLLPSADGNDFNRHIASLNRLREYADWILIPAHGPLLSGRERIEREIGCRIAYFTAVINSKYKLTYEEAVKDCGCDFLHNEWHRFIYD